MQKRLKYKIIVAGIPRSGTTYIFNHMGLYSMKQNGIHLDVMKTHGLAPPASSNDIYWYKTEQWILNGARPIFIFGDPILSVISTKLYLCRGKCPSKMFFHFQNCGHYQDTINCHLWGINRNGQTDIFDCDIFHYEMMFDSWMREQAYPMLSIRYETMQQHFSYINDFVGCNIEWYPWVDRKSKYSSVAPDELDRIKATYASLIEKIKNAPDCKIWEVE